MSPRLNSRSPVPCARLQNCTLSLLTAAILLAGAHAAPVMAADAPASSSPVSYTHLTLPTTPYV